MEMDSDALLDQFLRGLRHLTPPNISMHVEFYRLARQDGDELLLSEVAAELQRLEEQAHEESPRQYNRSTSDYRYPSYQRQSSAQYASDNSGPRNPPGRYGPRQDH